MKVGLLKTQVMSISPRLQLKAAGKLEAEQYFSMKVKSQPKGYSCAQTGVGYTTKAERSPWTTSTSRQTIRTASS